jgi:glycosyltransferase involved in cell wall biosynthesis
LPRFSVLTISFNQATFLERCIRSVIEQRGIEVQYVVVDPGSTDGSRELIERYSDHIDTVILKPDRGAAEGLNNGLAACSGEYFAFINADDELEPGALAEAARCFAAWPDIDVLCGDSWQVDEGGRIFKRLVSSRRITPRLCARQAVTIAQQSAFMRTESVRRVGGFDPSNRTSWDGELYYRLAAADARFRRVDRIWARFRVHGASITGSGRLLEQYHRDRNEVFRREFGRPRGPRDRFAFLLAYTGELLRDPRLVYWKFANRLGRARG